MGWGLERLASEGCAPLRAAFMTLHLSSEWARERDRERERESEMKVCRNRRLPYEFGWVWVLDLRFGWGFRYWVRAWVTRLTDRLSDWRPVWLSAQFNCVDFFFRHFGLNPKTADTGKRQTETETERERERERCAEKCFVKIVVCQCWHWRLLSVFDTFAATLSLATLRSLLSLPRATSLHADPLRAHSTTQCHMQQCRRSVLGDVCV